VLCDDLPWLDGLKRPTVPRHLHCVLTIDEVGLILSLLSGQHALLARLLYGTGMRIVGSCVDRRRRCARIFNVRFSG